MLEEYVRSRKKEKDILLMTHIVLGYPSFEDSIRIVDTMVEAGVDLIELQIPFSEPMADGPVILHANQRALTAGSTVARCFEVAAELTKRHPGVPFLFMSYFNIAYAHGAEKFAVDTRSAGVCGVIIPDLPFEEGADFYAELQRNGVEPIFLYSPNTSAARMQQVADLASGFIYCVARKGVTGAATNFAGLDAYLARCRGATKLPLALGFGVKNKDDVRNLVGKAEIAVVGSATIQVIDEKGVEAVGPFIESLVAR